MSKEKRVNGYACVDKQKFNDICKKVLDIIKITNIYREIRTLENHRLLYNTKAAKYDNIRKFFGVRPGKTIDTLDETRVYLNMKQNGSSFFTTEWDYRSYYRSKLAASIYDIIPSLVSDITYDVMLDIDVIADVYYVWENKEQILEWAQKGTIE